MPALIYGKKVEVAPGVHRITANNPGVMTAAGTNTYLLGQREIAVIDPGPLAPEHTDAIIAAAAELGGEIKYIVVTHTHMDHSPGAAPLAARTGAKMIGKSPDDHQFQDETFKPDEELADGYVLSTDEFSLRAIYTPGHVSNHYCLLEENAQVLFTGDHIMNGSTVVVVPPSGDMGAYIASLKKLLGFDLTTLAPAHGDTMGEPEQVIEAIIEHRLRRETKVLEALTAAGPSTIDNLVPIAYADVDEEMHGVAYYSLWAHLEKLVTENRVIQEEKNWRLS